MKVTFLHNGYESLGIEALSAALKKSGLETSLVIDPCLFEESGFWRLKGPARFFNLRKETMELLKAEKPDLLCFSVFTDNYRWALGWAEAAKKELGVPVAFGGIHPTSVPEKVIAKDCVDYVCVGEGDRARRWYREFVDGLGLPVLGFLRDTQNYIHLAARGLTLFDVAPSRVEKDLQQWQGVCHWLEP